MTLDQMGKLGRPLRADAERNRRRILAAAAEVFAKRGLDAGLDEIARHAGVGTGTVYRRFPDKSMLIDALFESRIDDMLAMARSALEMANPWDGLVFVMTRSTEMQLANRGLKELVFGDPCVGGTANPQFAEKIGSMVPIFAAIVKRCQASGDLRPDVTVADLAVTQFMLHGVGSFTESVAPEQWRRQLNLILDGLRVGKSQTPLPLKSLTMAELGEICTPPRTVSEHGVTSSQEAGRPGGDQSKVDTSKVDRRRVHRTPCAAAANVEPRSGPRIDRNVDLSEPRQPTELG
jgi:AcrR family transcriptional regulator